MVPLLIHTYKNKLYVDWAIIMDLILRIKFSPEVCVYEEKNQWSHYTDSLTGGRKLKLVFLFDGTVPSNYKLYDGTVTLNKKLSDGTVPSNSRYLLKVLFDSTLKNGFKIQTNQIFVLLLNLYFLLG